MTFRHPALRAKDRAAYGDGMFFFTRPVGAPDDESLATYGDGMFFFTQPVGAPDRIRPGTYGAAAAGTSALKGGAGNLRASLTGGAAGKQILSGTRTRTRYTEVSPADLTAFQKAAGDVGVWTFWYDFWSRSGSAPKATGGTRTASDTTVSGGSDEARSAAKAKVDAAKSALTSAKNLLLSDVPNNVASYAKTGQVLDRYASVLATQGWYGQAFRNVSGSSRKSSSLVFGAIRRDAMDPYVAGSLSLDSAVKTTRAYIRSDVQSYYGADSADWAIVEPTAKNKRLQYGPIKADAGSDLKTIGWMFTAAGWTASNIADVFKKGAHAWKKDLIVKDGTRNLYFLTTADANAYRTYIKQRNFRSAVLTSDFNTEISSLRSKQVIARDANNATLTSNKDKFLAARKAAYDEQAAAAAVRSDKTADIPADTTPTDTTVTEPVPTETPSTETPADTLSYVTTTPDTSGGAALPDITGGPPEGAQTLEVKDVEMKQVALPEKGPTEETFFSKNKVVIGLVAVAAIGGGYWWYTNKYLPSKAAGR